MMTTEPGTDRDRRRPAAAEDVHTRVSLCDALDRVLETGAVIVGDVVLTVADIELVYLGFQLVLTSVAPTEPIHMNGLLENATVTIANVEPGDGPE